MSVESYCWRRQVKILRFRQPIQDFDSKGAIKVWSKAMVGF